MYNKLDYVRRGIKFANNFLFPSRKKLSSLFFYSTTLCDSKCKHCLIWQKRPTVHMPKSAIIKIMQSRCVSKDTTVGLEGGEFLLHPEAMDILKWFRENHPNFDLLSNCLKPKKLIEAVNAHPPRRLYISLDGDKETYEYMRGCDGYGKVIEVIEACKDIVPISLMFTLSPYNGFVDMDYVIQLSKKYNIDIRIGVYNNISFFDTSDKAHGENKTIKESDNALSFKESIPKSVMETSENLDFLILYDEWRKGDLKLRCHSIFDSIVIHPNGDVPLCQNLDTKLGNIHENSLDEILNFPSTRKIQKYSSKNCNKCWINFHRKYDIVLLRTMEAIMPKRIIELFYGKYQWTNNTKISYRRFLKQNEG